MKNLKKLLIVPIVLTAATANFAFLNPANNDMGKDRNSQYSENIYDINRTIDIDDNFENVISSEEKETHEKLNPKPPEPKKFIKWIEFNASKDMLQKTNKAHKKLIEKGITDIGTCELLAYVALKNGNSFSSVKDTANLDKLIKEIEIGNRESIDRYKDNKYFKYYVESYHAVLDGIICKQSGDIIGFHPIAKGYWHTGSDDFGNSRSYGFKRRHLGHDLWGGVGTPIIAMEGGTITELGWNRFGGWRVGIRSDDTNRYYYYAHLRKDHPYPKHFEIGQKVDAGQVIGYLGRSGYSTKPNANMDTKPHLHFGMQIIFDKTQEDGNGEIWIDVYNVCRFLSGNKVKVVKDDETKEFSRSTN